MRQKPRECDFREANLNHQSGDGGLATRPENPRLRIPEVTGTTIQNFSRDPQFYFDTDQMLRQPSIRPAIMPAIHWSGGVKPPDCYFG